MKKGRKICWKRSRRSLDADAGALLLDLKYKKGIHPYALAQLQDEFEIEEQIFEIDGPLDITYFMKLAGTLNGYENLRYPRIAAKYPIEFEDTTRLLRGS